MKTIALKINENTPEGKAFLAMTNVFIQDKLGVELAGAGDSVMKMIGEVISNIKSKAPKVKTLDEVLQKEKMIKPVFL